MATSYMVCRRCCSVLARGCSVGVSFKEAAQDAKVILYTDNSYSVPVYDAADGVNKIGTLAKGAVVDILEVNGQWVRTTQGWIQSNCLAPC